MDYAQLTEQQLIILTRKGDISAKKCLYTFHVKFLTAVCSRYLVDRSEIKEVLQESFLKIFSNIGNFEYRGKGSLRGWMKQIVVNEALALLREKCRFDTVPLCGDGVADEDLEPDVEPIPVSALHAAISELPDGARTVLNLFVFEGRTHAEIARLLGIQEDTSASQFHRAKCLLANKLKDYHFQNPSIDYER